MSFLGVLPSLVGSTYIGDFGLTIAVISASLRRALPTECHPPLLWDALPTRWRAAQPRSMSEPHDTGFRMSTRRWTGTLLRGAPSSLRHACTPPRPRPR